ncbi:MULTISPECIES: ABC transporter ATP-binding protein [Salinibaculum]|uniref:ABC transporter ATP-binding protein n=1 Tax=Salinibaculum TaxID=2732368 RepID=UPI0030D20562
MSEPLLQFDDTTIQYQTPSGKLTAVSDASFEINRGEYFGLVGESGCGKTTLSSAVIGGLDKNGDVVDGRILYKGEDISNYSEKEYNENIRWKEISYIPQSSMNSLDPLERVDKQVVEIAQTHTDLSKEEALDKFEEMLEIVGISASRVTDYPHQFSGGMQQRVIIALALYLEPNLLIADEPTTALDVIMQDQIFKYLDNIKAETDTSLLLITHDISVVFESSDKMAIMHGGQVAETGTVSDIYDDPKHPYSIMLQKAFPDHRRPDAELETIEGVPPQIFGDVDRCTYADRCPLATQECRDEAPPLEIVGSDDHRASCFHTDRADELRESEVIHQ